MAVRPVSDTRSSIPLTTGDGNARDTRRMKTALRAMPSLRVSIPALAGLALGLQLVDLASFLLAVQLHPVLLDFEIGIIRTTYLSAGPLGAVAFKLAGIAVLFAALAVYGGRWTRAVLLAAAVIGALGAYANFSSIETIARLAARA